MTDKLKTQKYERRDFLTLAGTGVVALAGIGLFADSAKADAAAAAKQIKMATGGKAMMQGKIKLELPEIAENGNTVPFGVEVESPMTDDNYVKALHVYADKNPSPDVATFRFTPGSGKAKVSSRMRMIKSQNVIAVAEMSDGKFYTAKKAVKVTIGGCGG
ncbi:MAG: thiosulfate oxidation carrier protein SoxY [Rhodospirillales bacterium]|nr:thiosulfate oxidation carrier protein SoxY [Rhodospirillales bacterium]